MSVKVIKRLIDDEIYFAFFYQKKAPSRRSLSFIINDHRCFIF